MVNPYDPAAPVVPLPNPGEGGPVYPGGTDGPAVPQPDPTPVIPLPNPGEGGPVFPGVIPIRPRQARTRFLNAAFGYRPFHVLVDQARVSRRLGYAAVTAYGRVPAGYRTVTVTGLDGYVYIQKTLPFQQGHPSTVAIINTPSGLDLLQIPDSCCGPGSSYASFRVSNLALRSGPMDVLLGDGRVIYGDVRYKETTAFKRIQPGPYQFFFAQTSLMPMPLWQDIETLDSAFIGIQPVPSTVASLYLSAVSGSSYTVFLLPSGADGKGIQTLLTENR